eukprot:CAMPEP_0170567878 /NCGR_PEP_ID=MMETSP0211-20121228/80767_1 /TAXON_ID=311385 /ORGANISM="Pseudokeronopsis sp., Strain OXSARD2" /LENGTH=47 /DNA_ID= /DNA_START= /DNA_END= /DNA_ORIENTATION=
MEDRKKERQQEKDLSKSLEYLMSKRKEKMNLQMLKFLINYEEPDYFE